MINKTVLMSDAHNFSVQHQINPYYADGSVDSEMAQAEHASIRMSFEKAGVTVVTVPSPADSQDGVYTANWALVKGKRAVLARLPEVRKAEESHAREILESRGIEVIAVPDNLRFSGQGDALACGQYLFCGRNYRSDEEAQKFAADTLGYTRIQLETIPQTDENGKPVVNSTTKWADSFFYDIDLALAVIKPPVEGEKGLVAYCPEAFTSESQELLGSLRDIELIEVSLDEAMNAFALNLVSTGKSVVMSDSAPELASNLAERGIEVITPKIAELSKGGGYIRCTSLTLD